MISILVVDDNLNRVEEIKNTCDETLGSNYILFSTCASIAEAQDKIMHNYFDLLVCDLNLPRRPLETPIRDAGISLVRRIFTSKKYIVPSNTVAITSYADIQNEYEHEFTDYLVTILFYEATSDRWKKQLRSKLEQIHFSKYNRNRDININKVIITVHGIRTFGEWQNRLKNIVTATYPDIETISYKYGYFSIFSYMLPVVRSLPVVSFSKTLKVFVESNPDKTFDIVAHSFGTYIVGNTIKNLSDDYVGKIGTVILSGSVLSKNFDWQSLIESKKVRKVVNECSIKDRALLFNGLFVPFVGTGGLVGFTGGISSSLINRYFDGGHSHFFIKSGEAYDELMERYWLPLFASDGPALEVDERRTPNLLIGIWSAFTHNLLMFKWIFYIFIVVVVFKLFYCK